jgi:selT/selW/selH-like putative selenoprotein
LKQAHGNKVEILGQAGSGGIFDVLADGEVIFSKHREGRFPTEDEILDEVADRLGKE